jgi:predicted glutamine amidotransferase
MCRLLGILSSQPVGAANYLVDAECSLLEQSRIDPKRLQSDGWGVGYYVDGRSQVVKSEKPVYSEVERFRSVASNTKSRIIIAHVRAASNPRGLPKEQLISPVNSQPFSHGRFLFAHNGTINLPDEIAQRLGDYRLMIEGINDSEVYFWFLVKELEAGGNVPDALVNFENELQGLWAEYSCKHPDKKRPYVGLNAVLADGQRLYAYCRYSEEDRRSPSLCLKDQPVFQMCYRPGEPFLIASERLTKSDEWLSLTSGQLLTAEAKDGLIVHRVESLRGSP